MSHRGYLIKIVVERDGDGFYAYCPGLSEVHTCGMTHEEAVQNARNAATAILRTKKRYKNLVKVGPNLVKVHIPSKQHMEDIETNEEQIVIRV